MGGGGRGGRSKKERTKRNSDARRGRSHRSNSVRGVGSEEQQKTWMMVWGTIQQEGQRELGTSPILLRYECREVQKQERSCERVLL